MICIGIDGGGTTTRAVVARFVSSTPEVLGRGSAPSSNHYSVGLETATRHIAQAADEALKNANLKRDEIGAWGLGLAGACTHDEQKLWRSRLVALVGNAHVVVDEDVAAAHAGAFASAPALAPASAPNEKRTGVVCIAGTGANSFGIGADGRRARADGWGPLLGDRGSGYRIGENTIRAACTLHDKASPDDSASPLLVRVLDHFGVASVDALLPIVYAPTFTKDQISALVPIAVQCAQDGDDIACQILQNAGHDLAATCAAVMSSLDLCRVAPHGSILQNVSLVRQSFESHLHARFPNLELVEPRYEAVIGAAFLAFDEMFAL